METDSITPLQIGDTIPEALWHLPLQVVNHPEGRDTITLRDYKGKLIILDFWHTGCGACISNFPRLDSLSQLFDDSLLVLPVTFQGRQRVNSFLKKNPLVLNSSLVYAVEDSVLHKAFPHQLLPHYVWIGPHGNVNSYTPSEYVTAINIEKSLHKPSVTLFRKEDKLNHDYNMPIFNVTENAGTLRPVYYTAWGKHIKGLAAKSGIVNDSLNAQTRYYCINHSLLHLYAIALNSGLPLQPKRRVLEVNEPGRLIHDQAAGYLSKWQQEYTYTFETVVVHGTSKPELNHTLHHELNRFFNLEGRIEERNIPSVVLTTDQKPNGNLFTRGNQMQIFRDPSDKHSYIKNITIADLAHMLERAEGIKYPVVDKTGMTQAFDIKLDKWPTSQQEWFKILRDIGVEARIEPALLYVFVISDQH
ncbi:hypothetical protein GCM10007415_34640 [Parapedobacter pyrenivorans]|uniref:Thiol-disulfide isomerase or thioredoxin n=2 Tax=Parapedobacter pyrenivorans TaxID=1305674 RepID=A0A917HYW3_9SPHI|nr:hypothetical protein GCM10007415_34640 [Parapedobacter pyrenivorans]